MDFIFKQTNNSIKGLYFGKPFSSGQPPKHDIVKWPPMTLTPRTFCVFCIYINYVYVSAVLNNGRFFRPISFEIKLHQKFYQNRIEIVQSIELNIY